MEKIELLIDDSEALSAQEPVGAILFRDSEEEIRSEFTYLDAWMLCLIKGLDKLRDVVEGEVEIEFVDQPEPMILYKKQDSFSMEYFGVKVVMGTIEDFEVEFKSVIREFIEKFTQAEDGDLNTFFAPLSEYCGL